MSEKKKKPGRPSTGIISKRVTINMTETMAESVEKKALSLGLSVSAYIVMVLSEYQSK